LPDKPPNKVLEIAVELINKSCLTILNHGRQIWVKSDRFTEEEWVYQNKNSDWCIRAFAKLVAQRNNIRPCLLIVEYGPDVEQTRRLIKDLNIDSFVHWLPLMGRRDLMWLLSKISLGVGEFYDAPRTMWGGTGWEAFASAKPLLQRFNFDDREFESIYGYAPPPMLSVRTEKDVLQQMLFVADYPKQAAQIGERAREWFDTHNGIALAKKWLSLVTDSTVTIVSPVSTQS
jgi:glycosyltransferase involved in cell wall biosynthesis